MFAFDLPRCRIEQVIEIAVDFGMAGQDELGCPGRVRPFVQKVQRRGEAPVAERMTQRPPLGFEILEIRQPFQVEGVALVVR